MPGSLEYERPLPQRDPVPQRPPTPGWKPREWKRLKARRKMGEIVSSMMGQHYLRGAKGDRPNQADGASVRRGFVKLQISNDPKTPAFLAASTVVEASKYICGGRYSKVGRIVTDADLHTKRYLVAQNPKDPGRCYTEGCMTPRRIQGAKSSPHALAWGESCDGWRHFDCIGLIEFAVDWVTPKVYGGEIWQWASPAAQGIIGSVRMDETYDPVMDGDLVSRVRKGSDYHHIGMLYLDHGKAYVAQAEDTNVGVTTGKPYKSSDWSAGRYRLPDSILYLDEEVDEDYPSTECITTLGVPSQEINWL